MPRGAFALSLGGWATWAGLGILACRIKGQGHTWYCKGSETSCHNNAMFHTSLVQGFDDVLQHLCLLLRLCLTAGPPLSRLATIPARVLNRTILSGR